MLNGNKFLTGCGIGAIATLAGAALLSGSGKRVSRSRIQPFRIPEYLPIRTDRRATMLASKKQSVDESPISKTGALLPASEYEAQTHGEFMSNDSKVLLQGDSFTNVSTSLAHPVADLLQSRNHRASDWITAIGGIIVTIAVICFSLSVQKQIKGLSAQLTQSSEARIRVLQEGIRTDQRAWVGLAEATAQPLTADGGGFTIKLQNTGKTPALDLQISDAITMEDIDQSALLQEPNMTARHSAGTLMPGAVYTTDVWFKTSPEAMSSLRHDQLRAVNYIQVTYKDVFQRQHATKACFDWHNSLPGVKACDGYNELN
jgi:hypothetical protein